MAKTAPTQRFLNIADVQDDILILKNGELRQILVVEALNFALKSEQEQAAIIYQYQAFLNSLQFPIQITVQSRRLDLTPYLTNLEKKAKESTSPLVQAQIADYVDFVGRLINLGNIMEKHFYVTVPYSGTVGVGAMARLFGKGQVNLSDKAFAEAKSKMNDRTEQVRGGLSSIGLGVRPLTTQEIIQLLYSTYNPVEADEVALPPVAATPNS